MNQLVMNRPLSKVRLLFVAAGSLFLMLVCSMLFAGHASAHGYITDSRAHLCSTGVNTNCGPIQYEPFSVEGRGDFPEIGVPDGQIAGGTVFPELDEQSQNRWQKINLTGGEHTFHWKIVANHSTNTWNYYITKKGWDPNTPLSRDNLELFCSYRDEGAIPPNDVYNDCFIPNDRQGYHVIVGVWDIADTVNAFYQAVDVNLSINSSAPTTPAPGFPGDPDRFGEYPVWNPVRAYTTGEVVIHNGQLWEALWWSQAQEPGTTGQYGPWKLIGPAPAEPTSPEPTNPNPTQPEPEPNNPEPTNPEPSNPGTYPAWNATTIYTNEIVSHNGQLWKAQWWTQGQEPGTTGQYGPWQLVQ